MPNVAIGKKVMAAIDLLNSHPALNRGYTSNFTSDFNWWMSAVCVNGQRRGLFNGRWDPDDTVSFYRGSKGFKKYFEEYASKSLKKNPAGDKYGMFDCVRVPYAVVYGKSWKPIHIVYSAEMSYYIYDRRAAAKVKSKRRRLLEEWTHYAGYAGEMFHALTFESLLVKMAAFVKRNLGDKQLHDFHTKEERENHRKERPCHHIPIEKDGVTMYRMKSNKKHIDVPPGELNIRYWEWSFKNTPLGRKFKNMYGIDDIDDLWGSLC